MNSGTSLIAIELLLTMLASVHSALAQRTLGIAATNQQTILFWANSNGTNAVLQSTAAFGQGWISVTDTISIDYGSQPAVSLTNSSSTSFFRLSLTPPTPDGMAFIPPGWFTMGDTLDGDTDANPTNIYVSGFYIDTNLVTFSQWQTVYTYAASQGYGFDDAGAGKAANHPVQTVNWYDCVKWCNARSQLAGKTPVYYTDAAMTQVYNSGDIDAVYANWAANGYRLPTEAEWEKAARAGLSGKRFPWGNTISQSQANYYGDTNAYTYDLGPNGFNPIGSVGTTNPATSPVGSFPANAYGLYDMAGNVWEWCWDWYGVPYGQPATTNPTGPASGSYRVLRGGRWGVVADRCRSAFRIKNGKPTALLNYNGFRCVLFPAS